MAWCMRRRLAISPGALPVSSDGRSTTNTSAESTETTAQAPAPVLAPSIDGMRLSALRQLCDDARAQQPSYGPPRLWRPWERPPSRRAKGAPLTTEDVVFELVRPRTEQARAALVATLPPETTGPASACVSHDWDAPFDDLIGALAGAYNNGEDPLLWCAPPPPLPFFYPCPSPPGNARARGAHHFLASARRPSFDLPCARARVFARRAFRSVAGST